MGLMVSLHSTLILSIHGSTAVLGGLYWEADGVALFADDVCVYWDVVGNSTQFGCSGRINVQRTVMQYYVCMCLRSTSILLCVPVLVLIDRDNTPRWSPDKLHKVTADVVQSYFEPFPQHDMELQLDD